MRLGFGLTLALIVSTALAIFACRGGDPDDRIFTPQDIEATSFTGSERPNLINPGDPPSWTALGTFDGAEMQVYLFEGEADGYYVRRQTLGLSNFNYTRTFANVGLLCVDNATCDRMRDELDQIYASHLGEPLN